MARELIVRKMSMHDKSISPNFRRAFFFRFDINHEGINTTMRRAMNNESLIGLFKETLQWVVKKSGKISDTWPERNTTKTCSHCGYLRVFKGIPSGKKLNQRRGLLWAGILRKLDCRFLRIK